MDDQPNRAGRPGRPPVLRVAALAATVVSAAVLAGVLASQTDEPDPQPSAGVPAPPTERGDPAAAQRLAEQASEVLASDPRQALRLLIAASLLAPDRAGYRLEVAKAALIDVAPMPITSGSLGPGGPVTYAAISADGSFVVTNRDRGQVWHTYDSGRHREVRDPLNLDETIRSATTSVARQGANLLVNTPSGVYGMLTSAALTRDGVRLTDPVDVVALTVDGTVAVTVKGDTATLWRPDLFSTEVLATLPYHRPVTALATAQTSGVILAAGHDDGSVTVHAIDLTRTSTTRQTLTASNSTAIASVAMSADGSTVLAVATDGTATVWAAHGQDPQPTATVAAAVSEVIGGRGSYQTWLSSRGDYAYIADSARAPSLWAVADGQLAPLLDLGVGADPAVPAMISYDGRTLVTIGQDETLGLWDLSSIVDTLEDPLPRACPLAEFTDQAWREIVPDTGYANPCPLTGPPTLGVNNGIRPRLSGSDS